ncbi:MAG: flagellar hook capping protein [Paludibacterium sp.]|uniref:flagellar hook assembly protein FlgD n=1 Tax=Paludibacterium sp. TaxID=1917523 RepID=UPI0025EDAF65|nr:FlgD immunoglobulin-like domain containing protein [Paludibacterium sp.]MBV8046984.1 flagellar hook capping protein [Paludibacterium sp.]MBV8647242.1 flagellar hook capping protein [Paludibacterium sp.]
MSVPSTNNQNNNSNPYAILNGTNSNASSTSSSSSTGTNTAQSIQNEFLTLLTTQLQSQDPSNPMQNSQITSQMAEISQVSGMQNLNSTMQSLLQSQLSSQSLIAASTVGHAALVAGSTLGWDANTSGNKTMGAVSLASAAQQVTVSIQDSKGNTVRTLSLSDATAGMNSFAWDGKDSSGNVLPAGNYTFTAAATNPGSNGTSQSVTATDYNYKTIAAVSFTSSGAPQLVLSDGSTVQMSAVSQIS